MFRAIAKLFLCHLIIKKNSFLGGGADFFFTLKIIFYLKNQQNIELLTNGFIDFA